MTRLIKIVNGACNNIEYTYTLKQVADEYIMTSVNTAGQLVDTVVWDINRITELELTDMLDSLEANLID